MQGANGALLFRISLLLIPKFHTFYSEIYDNMELCAVNSYTPAKLSPA